MTGHNWTKNVYKQILSIVIMTDIPWLTQAGVCAAAAYVYANCAGQISKNKIRKEAIAVYPGNLTTEPHPQEALPDRSPA